MALEHHEKMNKIVSILSNIAKKNTVEPITVEGRQLAEKLVLMYADENMEADSFMYIFEGVTEDEKEFALDILGDVEEKLTAKKNAVTAANKIPNEIKEIESNLMHLYSKDITVGANRFELDTLLQDKASTIDGLETRLAELKSIPNNSIRTTNTQ